MPLLHLRPSGPSEEDRARAEAVHRESEARTAIEQANAEATRARQDRIAEAEIEAIRNGRHAEATTINDSVRPSR
jgi:hypothetical protein